MQWEMRQRHHHRAISQNAGAENRSGRSQSRKYQKYLSRVAEKAKERQRKLNPVDCISMEGEDTRALS